MTNDAVARLSDLWCGSYTADSDGHGSGISVIRAGDNGALLPAQPAVAADSPSFLAEHPSLPVVYAVGEFAKTIQAYSIVGADQGAADAADAAAGAAGADATGGTPEDPTADLLRPLGDAWPAGEAVCHVTVDPAGRYAIAACWGDGQVLAYELDQAGRITARHAAEAATDPYADGDRQSRAHASIVLPDGRILTTDLGYDIARIWRYELGRGLVPDHEVTLPHGSGPRHPALHPSGHVYIVTEDSVEVVVLAPDAAGRYSIVHVASVMKGGSHDGDTAAHISVDESGEHVHVTVRGANRLAVLAVRDGGARLEPVTGVDCGGNWPRHHLQRGPVLHVANQLSDSITTFQLDAGGVPTALLQTLPVGTPTCLIERR
jgi:6-phosphogluconolactonase